MRRAGGRRLALPAGPPHKVERILQAAARPGGGMRRGSPRTIVALRDAAVPGRGRCLEARRRLRAAGCGLQVKV